MTVRRAQKSNVWKKIAPEIIFCTSRHGINCCLQKHDFVWMLRKCLLSSQNVALSVVSPFDTDQPKKWYFVTSVSLNVQGGNSKGSIPFDFYVCESKSLCLRLCFQILKGFQHFTRNELCSYPWEEFFFYFFNFFHWNANKICVASFFKTRGFSTCFIHFKIPNHYLNSNWIRQLLLLDCQAFQCI